MHKILEILDQKIIFSCIHNFDFMIRNRVKKKKKKQEITANTSMRIIHFTVLLRNKAKCKVDVDTMPNQKCLVGME